VLSDHAGIICYLAVAHFRTLTLFRILPVAWFEIGNNQCHARNFNWYYSM